MLVLLLWDCLYKAVLKNYVFLFFNKKKVKNGVGRETSTSLSSPLIEKINSDTVAVPTPSRVPYRARFTCVF